MFKHIQSAIQQPLWPMPNTGREHLSLRDCCPKEALTNHQPSSKLGLWLPTTRVINGQWDINHACLSHNHPYKESVWQPNISFTASVTSGNTCCTAFMSILWIKTFVPSLFWYSREDMDLEKRFSLIFKVNFIVNLSVCVYRQRDRNTVSHNPEYKNKYI